MGKKFITLEALLSKDTAELTALKQDEFETEKLGGVPFTALDTAEYKQIKKDCMKMVPDGTGGKQPELDDDKLMIRAIIAAVDKDDRTDFTFQSKALLEKLEVTTADQAVNALLSPGELYRFAVSVQDLSGFSNKAKQETKDAVKNS